MTDEEIIAIRDRLLPSQGEPFDTLAFGRAVMEATRERLGHDLEALTAAWNKRNEQEAASFSCADVGAAVGAALTAQRDRFAKLCDAKFDELNAKNRGHHADYENGAIDAWDAAGRLIRGEP